VRGGYFDAYGRNPEPKAAPAADAFEIEAAGIGIKPYACCGAGCAVVDAALDLRAENALHAGSVESVDVAVSPMAASIMPFHAAHDGAHAKYSAAYCAAVALVDGRAGLAQFEDARVGADDVQRVLARTRVRTDARLAFGGGRFGVEMTIVTADGRRVSTSLEIPRGDRQRPLEPERLLEKFLECAAPVLGERRARDVAVCMASLEHEEGVARLARLLVPGEAPA
jgi:2-methylcitrate dehydratase PrpD